MLLLFHCLHAAVPLTPQSTPHYTSLSITPVYKNLHRVVNDLNTLNKFMVPWQRKLRQQSREILAKI
jgi:hypothetical protein